MHGEDHDGWMTWLFAEGVFGFGRSSTIKMYRVFSEDVKRRAEEQRKLREGIAASQSDPWVKL